MTGSFFLSRALFCSPPLPLSLPTCRRRARPLCPLSSLSSSSGDCTLSPSRIPAAPRRQLRRHLRALHLCLLALGPLLRLNFCCHPRPLVTNHDDVIVHDVISGCGAAHVRADQRNPQPRPAGLPPGQRPGWRTRRRRLPSPVRAGRESWTDGFYLAPPTSLRSRG